MAARLSRLFEKEATWPFRAGILAFPVFATFVIVGGLMTPGHDHASKSLSHLAQIGKPHPEVSSIGILVLSTCLAAFGYGLTQRLEKSWPTKILVTGWVICVAGLVMTVVIRSDATDFGETLRGSIHVLMAMSSFAGMELVLFAAGVLLLRRPDTRPYGIAALVIALVDLVLGIAFAQEFAVPFSGALERTFYTLALLWVAAVSLHYLRRDRSKQVTGESSAALRATSSR